MIQLLSATTTTGPNPIFTYILMAVMIVGMFWFSSRSQKKKEKEAKDMLDRVEIGSEVVTIGGVVGIVVSINKENVVVETGSNRTKIRFLREAISKIVPAETENDD